MSSDVSGFSLLVRNVLTSWVTQVVMMVVGFVLPRLISDNLGKDMLGIWDLGWATLRYLGMVNLAVTPAMTRYIALYRSQDDLDQVRKVINVGIMWQIMMAALLFAAGSAFVELYTYTAEAGPSDKSLGAAEAGLLEAILFYFVISIAFTMLRMPSSAILTGYHRFDWQNMLNSIEDIALAVVFIIIIMMDGNLINLAEALVVVGCIFIFVRYGVAIWITGKIDFRFTDWSNQLAKKLFTFGMKSTLWNLPNVLTVQTIVFMTGAVSTEAVAVFSRAVALVRFGGHAVKRTTSIIMPIVSSLEGQDKTEENRALVLKMAFYTSLFYFPMVAILAIMGKYLLLLWMGPGYDNGLMIAAFALGSLLPISQTGTYQVLVGNNQHGKIALQATVICSILMAGAYVAFQYVTLNATLAAISAGIIWTLSYSIILPLKIKQVYQISLTTYYWYGLFKPMLASLPLCIGLAIAHLSFIFYGISTLTVVLALGIIGLSGGIMLVVYWCYMFEPEVRQGIAKKVRFLKRWA